MEVRWTDKQIDGQMIGCMCVDCCDEGIMFMKHTDIREII